MKTEKDIYLKYKSETGNNTPELLHTNYCVTYYEEIEDWDRKKAQKEIYDIEDYITWLELKLLRNGQI